MITSNWEVSWAIPNWRYRCPAWAHLLAECPIQNPVFLLPALFGDCLSNKNKHDVFAGHRKEKVKRIVLCCALPCKSYDKHWVHLCLIFERLIFKVCLFRNLERLKNWIACENRKNRTRPYRETPLWQGAKKHGSFRRLSILSPYPISLGSVSTNMTRIIVQRYCLVYRLALSLPDARKRRT